MTSDPAPRPFPRRRDRRGRGPRGPVGGPQVPLRRSRADRFDDLVLDAVEHLEQRWGEQLSTVELAIEAVPPDDLPSVDGDPVALSRLEVGGPGPTRIVLYRRPLEARGIDTDDLADLVLDVLVHDVARLLELTPEDIDPEGHPSD